MTTGNSASVTIDGELDAIASNNDFGSSFTLTKTLSPATLPHTARVVVVAGDGPNNSSWSPDLRLGGPCLHQQG